MTTAYFAIPPPTLLMLWSYARAAIDHLRPSPGNAVPRHFEFLDVRPSGE